MRVVAVETEAVFRTLVVLDEPGGEEDLADAINDIETPENDQCRYKPNSFGVIGQKVLTGIIDAHYTTVWDDGVQAIRTKCKFDTETLRCFDIQKSNVDADTLEILDREYVSIEIDGEEFRLTEEDGVEFDY